MNDTAKVSVERLFAEPFEPQWMKRQRQAIAEPQQDEYQRWRKLIVERSEMQWRLEAVKSQRRIVAKYGNTAVA